MFLDEALQRDLRLIDGAGSLGCRIFGRLRSVRIVRKRGAIEASKRAGGKSRSHDYPLGRRKPAAMASVTPRVYTPQSIRAKLHGGQLLRLGIIGEYVGGICSGAGTGRGLDP